MDVTDGLILTNLVFFRFHSSESKCEERWSYFSSDPNVENRFAPAIALSIVTDMSITACIFVIGLIVTLYTSLGGLKGVVWTDFFQFSIMMIGLIAVIVRGANISGGMAKTFEKAHAGGRIEFWK